MPNIEILGILAKDMHYLYYVLLKNGYLEWMIKEPKRKPSTPIINPENNLEIKNSVFISVIYVPGLI